jgi:hypothetical protein
LLSTPITLTSVTPYLVNLFPLPSPLWFPDSSCTIFVRYRSLAEHLDKLGDYFENTASDFTDQNTASHGPPLLVFESDIDV